MKSFKNLLTLFPPSFMLSVFLIGIASASPTRIYVNPSSVTGLSPGETFTIDINVEDVTNLYGFDFKLGYDTSILDATQIVIETWLSSGAECKDLSQILPGDTCAIIKNVDAGGYVWVVVTLLQPAAPVSGDGTLATITFQVTGTGVSALDLYETVLVNSTAIEITHGVDDGNFDNTPGTPDSCSDSDGGFNPKVKGTVSGYQDGIYYSYTDVCIDVRTLREYYCVGTQWSSDTVRCKDYGSDYTCPAVPSRCMDTGGEPKPRPGPPWGDRPRRRLSLTEIAFVPIVIAGIAVFIIFGFLKSFARKI